MINRKEKRHEFTRGAEVMRHEFSLYFGALFFSAMIAFITALGSSLFIANGLFSDDEGEIFLDRLVAEYNILNNEPGGLVKMELTRGSNTKTYELSSEKLIEVTEPDWVKIKKKLWITAGLSILCGIGLFFMTNWAWRKFGQKVGTDEVVRGAVFSTAEAVTKELNKAGKASDVKFAGVPLEKGKEVLNTMVTGAIGTGKSVAISEALYVIRLSKQKAVVVDVTGEYIERFYREGQDIILSPFDVRSPSWSPWNEIREPYDYATVAESFIPVKNTKEPFWEEGAQAVLEDVMSRLAKHNQMTNRRLVEVVNVLSLKEINAIVKNLPGAVYTDPDAAKTALGIRMNVVRAAKTLRYMGDGTADDQFSIRDWMASPEQDSWLFLSAREDMLTTMRPLLTAWLDTCLRAVMNLKPDRERLIWNVVDELAALTKVPSLKEATTRARKYGLASLLGYQNIAQLWEDYGRNDAQTIVSMCQNALTLRVPDHQTADYIAKNLGSQEIYERDENISYGQDSSRDGVTITTKRAEKNLVMAAEIQGLPDLTGYLRLAGRNEVIPVKFNYRQYPKIAEGFIMKDKVDYALDDEPAGLSDLADADGVIQER